MFTLGRKIDLNYKTNQLIASFVCILALIVWLATNQITAGLSVAGGVFLTWALSRELDPVHDYAAFVAAALSLFILMDIQSIQLLPLVWVLLLLRAVNGITGKELTLLDIASILGFTIYLSLSQENSIYFIVFILAMVFISYTSKRKRVAAGSAILGFLLFVLQNLFVSPLSIHSLESITLLELLVILSAILSPLLFWFVSAIEVEDDKGNKVSRSKLFTGQLLYVISVLLFLVSNHMPLSNQIIHLSIVFGLTFYFSRAIVAH